MLIQIITYLIIACKFNLVLCRPKPQSQSFSSNPYYDRYNDQYGGDNGFINVDAYSPYSTTQKPLYPSLFPQTSSTSPPYYEQGQHNRSPPIKTSFNRNSSIEFPTNSLGGNHNFYGWNTNFNPHTTSSSYQPYGESVTTTVRPPITTLPPVSFNQYNRTNSTFPNNRLQPNFTNNRPQPIYPNNQPQPTYPYYQPTIGRDQLNTNVNFTSNTNNTFSNRNWNKNSTAHQYPFSSQNTGSVHPNPVIGLATKNSNFFNHNFNRTDNNYNPLYRPSAPSLMPQGNIFTSKPNFDQDGIPLASYGSFHSNTPTDDNLFNYDNLHRRRPTYGMESGPYENSNVPLASFPGSRGLNYGIDPSPNVPLAPFPGNGGPNYGYDSNPNTPLAPFPRKG